MTGIQIKVVIMSGVNILTPLLKNKPSLRYGDFINKGIRKRVRVSIEDVVDSACSVPSCSFLMVLFGIFTFVVVS